MTDELKRPPAAASVPETRKFNVVEPAHAPPEATRDPLDAVPWVVELRVMGRPDTIQLNVQDAVTLGRGGSVNDKPHIDLSPYGAHEQGVSRTHAVLAARKQFLTLQDLSSTNGTKLNGHRIQSGQPFPLEHGDEITLGSLGLQLRFTVLPPKRARTGGTGRLTVEGLPQVGEGEHILVIEPDKSVASAYLLALEYAGYIVSTTETAQSVAQLLEQWLPDAIVAELRLEQHGQVDVVQLLRSNPLLKATPLIVVSSHSGGHLLQQALQAGANAALTKPVRLDELVLRLHDVLGGGQSGTGPLPAVADLPLAAAAPLIPEVPVIPPAPPSAPAEPKTTGPLSPAAPAAPEEPKTTGPLSSTAPAAPEEPKTTGPLSPAP